jgi:hypothetical protein
MAFSILFAASRGGDQPENQRIIDVAQQEGDRKALQVGKGAKHGACHGVDSHRTGWEDACQGTHQGDVGVVVVGHGPVAGLAAADQVQVLDLFLRHSYAKQRPVAQHATARIKDDAAAALVPYPFGVEFVQVMFHQPAHALRSAGLFVRHRQEYDGTPERHAFSDQLIQRQEVHHAQAFGIERPAPPHVPFGDLSCEGWVGPTVRIGGHDVYVVVQNQRL